MPFAAQTIAFEASGTKQPSARRSGKRLLATDHVRGLLGSFACDELVNLEAAVC